MPNSLSNSKLCGHASSARPDLHGLAESRDGSAQVHDTAAEDEKSEAVRMDGAILVVSAADNVMSQTLKHIVTC